MSISTTIAGSSIVTPIRRALRNDFVRHGALVFAASMAGNVLNYLFNFAISRRVGVEGYAALSALVGVLTIVSIPAAIVNIVVVKYTAEFHAVGDHPKLWRFSQLLLAWSTLAAVAMLAAGLVLSNSIASYLHIANDTAVTLCIFIIALGFMIPSVRGILQGEQDFKRYSISTLLELVLKVGLGVGLVYAGFGIVGAMSGWIAGTAVSLVYTVVALRSHRVGSLKGVRLALDLRRLVQVTVGIAVTTAAMTLLGFMDVVLVKHYFDAHAAGLYAAVNLTGKVVLFLVSFLPLILLPKVVARSKRGEPTTNLLLQAAGGTIAFSAVVLAGFAARPQLAISLLAGRAFIAGAPFVFQYDLAMGLLACLSVVVNYKVALHRFEFLVPLVMVVVAEIAGIALYHRTLWDVIHILLMGNAAAVAACSIGIWKTRGTALVQKRAA